MRARWAIYIDVEGSSKIYAADETHFFSVVDALIDGISRIGAHVFPESPNRLFVHQTGGDGFVIVSDFPEQSPERPLAIAIVLMRKALTSGGVAKAGISQGGFADVQSCFPTLHSYPLDTAGRRRLGRGIMTVFPVMGTALINAHRLATGKPRGARLAIDRAMIDKVPDGVVVSHENTDLIVVDWIHTCMSTLNDIASKAGIQVPSAAQLCGQLRAYVKSTGGATDEDWKQNTLHLNGCL